MRMVTGGHLGDDVLIDLLDGAATDDARAHAASCVHCRARLEGATAGLDAARDAEVPEPSPLFWQSFRRQVDSRIRSQTPSWRRLAVSPWLAAAAAVVAAVALLVPGGPERGPAPAASVILPAWSPLPPADEDPGLEVLAAVVPETASADALADCQGLGDCLADAADLSDEERAALAEDLRREMGVQS
jgi:hypothetical protein